MPISPGEAKKRREGSIFTDLQFKANCADIDKFLTSPRHPGTGQWWWSTAGVAQEQIEAILVTYRATGWKVEIGIDPRDGNYLAFDDK